MIGAILVVIFGFMLLSYQVRHTEVAIRTTFGNPVVSKNGKADIGPGFRFRFPWPINEVYKFDNRIQNSEWTFETTSTTEGKPILVKVFATWRISNALQFFQKFSGDLSLANKTLESTVRSAQNSVIGKYTFEQIVNTDADLIKLSEIEEKMKDEVTNDSHRLLLIILYSSLSSYSLHV